ncbi:hypothetical protein [Holdemanella biformis]
MKTSYVDRESSEIIEEEEKMREINEEIERFKKETKQKKNIEEKREFVNRFEEFMAKYGPAFELNVIPTLEGPIVTGKANASFAFIQVIEGMDSDEIKECFTECTKAFGMELRRQLTKHRKKESSETSHCMN